MIGTRLHGQSASYVTACCPGARSRSQKRTPQVRGRPGAGRGGRDGDAGRGRRLGADAGRRGGGAPERAPAGSPMPRAGTGAGSRARWRACIPIALCGERVGVGVRACSGTGQARCRSARTSPGSRFRPISDWLMARERERSLTDDQAEHERSDGGDPREHGERPPRVPPEALDQSQTEHDAAQREPRAVAASPPTCWRRCDR